MNMERTRTTYTDNTTGQGRPTVMELNVDMDMDAGHEHTVNVSEGGAAHYCNKLLYSTVTFPRSFLCSADISSGIPGSVFPEFRKILKNSENTATSAE